MSVYPGAIDVLTDPVGTNPLGAPLSHATLHADVNDAIEKIEATLGINPQGASVSVVARLATIDAAIALREVLASKGVAGGYVGLDADDAITLVAGTPSAPAAGRAKLAVHAVGARPLPGFRAAAGPPLELQPMLSRAAIGYWRSGPNTTTTPTGVGLAAPTATGTVAARTVATSSLLAAMRRIGYVSSAAAGSVTGFRAAGATFLYRGAAAGRGGFFVVIRFAISDAVLVDGQTFVGLRDTVSAPTAAAPSTFVNCLGVGQDAGETVLSIYTNDGAGAAVKTSLGASFSVNITDAYEVVLFSEPNGSTVTWYVENLSTGASASGTLSSELPANTTLLTLNCSRGNAAVAAAAAIDLIGAYVESPS